MAFLSTRSKSFVRWKMLDASAAPADIDTELGAHVSKIKINHHDAIGGISKFLMTHRPDLLVLASHGRQGINRWIHGSIAEDVLRRTHVPSLLSGPNAEGFVQPEHGDLNLRNILIPVAPEPDPSPAWALNILSSLLTQAGVEPESCELMHVAGEMPDILDMSGKTRKIANYSGPVVETIVREATERKTDLIAMATAGHHGVLDGLRGSTTSQVLARAPCPVLALPSMQ